MTKSINTTQLIWESVVFLKPKQVFAVIEQNVEQIPKNWGKRIRI